MTDTTVRRPRPPQGRRRRTTNRALIVLAVLAAALVVAVLVLGNHVVGRTVKYPNVFGPIPENTRPRPAVDGAETYLLVGTDGGSVARAYLGGPVAAQTVQIVRVAPDGDSAQVIGLSRDALTDIPGRGPGPLGSALAAGGPTALVQAVEGLTGVRVDHFATVDFPGFTSLVDRFGGIDVAGAPGVHLDGEQALTYLRTADSTVDGDATLLSRQQEVLRGLLRGASQASVLTLPATVDDLSRSVGFDDTMGVVSILTLGADLGSMSGDAITFVTAPVAGPGAPGDLGRPTQILAPSAATLFAAVRDGRVGDWVARNPAPR